MWQILIGDGVLVHAQAATIAELQAEDVLGPLDLRDSREAPLARPGVAAAVYVQVGGGFVLELQAVVVEEPPWRRSRPR